MKTTDLMIGDWLRVNRDGVCLKNGTIVKVLGLDSESKLKNKGLIGVAGCIPLDKEQFSRGIWCEYLSPIPLTPAILEQNGFVKSERYEVWKIINDDYEMRITPRRFAVIFLEDGADKEEFSIPRPNFVHELQHALRLCGIEKEVVL